MKTQRYFFAVLFSLILGCSAPPEKENDTQGTTPAGPVVTDDRTDLVLSWFSDGGPQVGSAVADVPAEARNEVRVQDPTIPPEQRDPAWIFLADLRKPGPDGRYAVRAEQREKYERDRRRATLEEQPSQAEAGGADRGPAPTPIKAAGGAVVMYSTRYCPVCKDARRWLLDQRIPYVERDVQKDPAAAADLAQKGRAQGVPTTGVPVFEIGGRLLPGFDPATIKKMLAGTLPSERTI